MLGMSEEQFWHSNPRIIKVWEQAYKDEMNAKNRMEHIYGRYTLSAMITAVDHCLNGRKAKSEYLDEPIRLFPKTEEEKAIDAEIELQKFIAWGNSMISNSKSKQ